MKDLDHELLNAAASGRADKIREAASNGANPEATDDDWSALHFAVSAKASLAAFQALIDAGCRVTPSTPENALHLAIRRSLSPDIVSLLAEHADPEALNQKDGLGQTPFGLAAKAYRDELSIVLATAGADPFIKNADGLSVMNRLNNRSDEHKKAVLDAIEAKRSESSLLGINPTDVQRTPRTGSEDETPGL